MKIVYCIIGFLASFQCTGQPILGIAEPGAMGGNYGSVNYLDVSTVGQKKVASFSYDDVRGSAFWDEKWNAAIFYLGNNRFAKVKKARLNLYTNEINFIIQDGKELALENTQVFKVIFFKGSDTTTVLSVFESMPDSLSPTKYSYYHVLNEGKFRLLALQKINISEGEYEPTLGKRDHSFNSKTNYAIANDQDIIFVKSLNQQNIFAAIPITATMEKWVTENKNKLKTEAQVVAFLNLYNSQITSPSAR